MTPKSGRLLTAITGKLLKIFIFLFFLILKYRVFFTRKKIPAKTLITGILDHLPLGKLKNSFKEIKFSDPTFRAVKIFLLNDA
jgi:hypothetical protein